MNKSRYDQYGYYTVGDLKTYSKLEAIELAKNDIKKVNWNFNDDVFSLYDWTKEPNQSVNYFYDKRAQELRNQYDYIVLAYSGGYDSHNILKTFIDNGLHLDEILTLIPGKTLFGEGTFEYNNYTEKRLEKYQDVLKNTKIRVLEYAESISKIVNDINIDDYVYLLNSRYAPNHLVRANLVKLVGDYDALIKQGKKVLFLYGIDKPLIKLENSEYYCVFRDSTVSNIVIPNNEFYHGATTEFFYWSRDTVPMIIKQAHILKNFYKNYRSSGNVTSTLLQPSINQEFRNKDCAVNLAIYPRCIEDSIDGGYFDQVKFNKIYDRRIISSLNIDKIMGFRDAWLYMTNAEVNAKIKKVVDYVTKNRKFLFVKNNPKNNFLIGITKEYKL